MQVKCGDLLSSSRYVCSGGNLGSVLGPLLFIIYVNSNSGGLVSQCMAFAEDFKIFLHCSDRGRNRVFQHMIALQTDIDRISATAAS